MNLAYRVLLYYKFVEIERPEAFAAGHRLFCEWLGLRGRIIVAHEGINGTVSGTVADTSEYMAALERDPRFAGMEFKIDEHDSHAFPRLSVKARSEIVKFGRQLIFEDDAPDVLHRTAPYLEPAEWCEKVLDPEVLVIDGRNDYEYDLGRFVNAIRPDVGTFSEAGAWLERNLSDKKRTILTYCTGGIRCEKLSAYLLDLGYENVYQLHGGIAAYAKDPEVRGAHFEGKCFVFDDRIAVPINSTDSKCVVGICYHCGRPSENYVNCANVECNRLYLCCEECETRTMRCCCDDCRTANRHREKGQKLAIES